MALCGQVPLHGLHAHCSVPTCLPTLHPLLPRTCAGGSERVCVALLYAHQALVGVALPTLLAAFTCPPPAAQHQRPRRQHQQSAQQPTRWRKLSRFAAAAEEQWWAVNALLCELCTGAALPAVQTALGFWLLAGNVWLLAKAAAHQER